MVKLRVLKNHPGGLAVMMDKNIECNSACLSEFRMASKALDLVDAEFERNRIARPLRVLMQKTPTQLV